MAVAQAVLTDARRATLEALCETFVPALEADSVDPVEAAFMARGAAALRVAAQVEGLLAEAMETKEIEAVGQLLDALAAQEFAAAPLEARTAIVHAFAGQDPGAKLGLRQLKGLAFLFFYALPDEAGSNPNWEAIGYPGPISAAPDAAAAPKTIATREVSGEAATLSADVCIVGSGAGGAVLAARCAAAGRDVLVLEAGGYNNEQDFRQLELPGYLDLYYGAGLAASESGSISVLAGQTLGGGTVVNYMNCVRTPERVLREWAGHGLDGLDDPAFLAAHMDPVMERIGANTEATRQNATHRRMIAGCDALGYEHRPLWRNASLDDEPANCGYCGFGCQQGCKRSAMKTWLQDASDAGARVLVGCHADRVLAADGRASGVEATVTHADGSITAVTIEATTVVVAGGSVESPALLLRSGIGGPAVGKNLRLHPAYIVVGVYEDRIDGWEGQIQSALSDHFFELEDGRRPPREGRRSGAWNTWPPGRGFRRGSLGVASRARRPATGLQPVARPSGEHRSSGVERLDLGDVLRLDPLERGEGRVDCLDRRGDRRTCAGLRRSVGRLEYEQRGEMGTPVADHADLADQRARVPQRRLDRAHLRLPARHDTA